ncbi:MAG TPA: hypothetical protein VK548_17160 [Candidatus Acidoferrum sp.]|nr:hypothetical protein [Candidatus Acidoferrum sp.]
MWRPLLLVIALLAGPPASAAFAQDTGLPGSAASPQIVVEIQEVVEGAVARFHAMDEAGLLALVSAQYRTDTLTKAGIADQLRTVFTLHDQVRARVRIDAVRMVGEHAWVYSTGQVTGRLRVVGSWIPVASWERELEIARRENGRWRLYGYQR